jgi:phosphoglucosamine mutase
MDKLRFGTDGIRGRAGAFPIDPASAAALGRALGGGGRSVIVAADPRVSGPWIVAAVAAGVREAGGRAESVGILPTPALSVLLAAGWADQGVMVTASHNGPADNGLKVLGCDGRKLGEEAQDALEERLDVERRRCLAPPAEEAQPAPRAGCALETYHAALLSRLPAGPWLAGRRIVVDAGHGAASATAPAVLAALGAEVLPVNCDFDGAAINVGCGALHPSALTGAVRAEGAHAGIALDGDADRGVLVTATGRALDGDALLFLLAEPPAVVGTVMSGAGLEQGLAARGIALHRTAVGDRFVDEAVHDLGLAVGAEPSGHVCLRGGLPTADGMLSCLRALAGGLDLEARLADYRPWPRCQREVRAAARRPLEGATAMEEARARALERLGPGGRVLLRYSGTEPVLRILAEGREPSTVAAAAEDLAHAARAFLGS